MRVQDVYEAKALSFEDDVFFGMIVIVFVITEVQNQDDEHRRKLPFRCLMDRYRSPFPTSNR
jgi:hypothetical protein